MTLVRFLKNSAPYAAGEVAGFDGEYANALVAQRLAELVQPEKPTKK